MRAKSNKVTYQDKCFHSLGHLVSDLLLLEIILRGALYNWNEKNNKTNNPNHHSFPKNKSFLDYKIGQKVPLNAITNYDTLGFLIKQFNKQVATNDPAKCVDASIVDIRDAIAHGRKAKVGNTYMTLIKFTQHKNGPPKVHLRYKLSNAWLQRQIAKVSAQIVIALMQAGAS